MKTKILNDRVGYLEQAVTMKTHSHGRGSRLKLWLHGYVAGTTAWWEKGPVRVLRGVQSVSW